MVKSDLFTADIIKSSLIAIGEEMFIALQRTSMSPIIYEALDYGIGITDPSGQLISQGNGIPGFIGTLDGTVRAVLGKYGRASIKPGDIFITNDPYQGGGTHLSDVSMVMPVFYDDELVAWTANKAHWTEMGGKDPGSFSADATEIYQEGLQLPTIRIYRQGKIDPSVVDILTANVRLPEMTLGDLHASAAALKVGESRMTAIIDKYGLVTTLSAIRRLLDHGEAIVRDSFKQLPQGTFEAQEIIDTDGLGNGPFYVKVKVTLREDAFIVDFTGSSPQAPGPINNTRTALESAVREVFMGIVKPGIPANAGCFRPIEIICPEGTICSAQRPAPVSAYFESMVASADAIRRALAEALPDRLIAGQVGSVCAMILDGRDERPEDNFLLVQPLVGGWGANSKADGVNGQFCVGNGETSNIPIEIAERRYKLHVERYAFHDADGGAGRQRGGKGVVLDYRIQTAVAHVSTFFGRGETPPWGVDGGQPGSLNYAEVMRTDGTRKRFSRASRIPLQKGDLLRLVTANGGGWGSPEERDKRLIEEDLRNGFITPDQASRDYGYQT